METTATLIVGGFAALVANRWKRRQQNNEDLHQAIADLLELRLTLDCYVKSIEMMQARFPNTAPIMPLLKREIFKMLPLDPEFHSRYSKAVDAVARYDPILGFRLRSRDFIRKIINWTTDIPPEMQVGPLANTDLMLAKEGIKVLGELIPEIARNSSWRLGWRAKRLINRPASAPPEELEVLIAQMSALCRANMPTGIPKPNSIS